MPTASELLKRLQGGGSAAPEESAVSSSAADLLKRLGSSAPGGQAPAAPEISDVGVQSYRLRAALSFMDTPEEQEAMLTKKVGKEGFMRAPNGALALTPQGLEKLGLPKSDKPVLIDQPGFPSLKEFGLDIADYAGSVPEILGATGAGMAASGAGLLPGMASAGLGAAAGRAGTELAEQFAGANQQPLPDVAKNVGISGAFGAAGEGIGRGVAAGVGRVLHPFKAAPERVAIAHQAREIGAQPSVGKVLGEDAAPFYARMEGLMQRFFTSPNAQKNARALDAEIMRLRGGPGRSTSSAEVGTQIADDIKEARKALGTWAGKTTAAIDELTGGQPVVPTAALKNAAQQMFEELPKTADGQPVMVSPETLRAVGQLSQLPETVTVKQAQQITERLWNAADDPNLFPGIAGGQARHLHRASREMFNNIPGPAGDAVRAFRQRYASKVERFSDSMIARVLKDPEKAGRLEPEQIVGAFFRRGQHTKLERLNRLIKPETQKAMRSIAMEDILGNIVQSTDDPVKKVFDGKALGDALDKYGQPTLRAMFGKQAASDLRRLAQVTSMVAPRQGSSGGLVAAQTALNPIQNLPGLAKFRILSQVLAQPGVIRWLTEGIRMGPETTTGAALLNRVTAQFMALAEQPEGKRDGP